MKESKNRKRMIKERVGGLDKVTNIFGEEVLTYLESIIGNYEFECSYDVTANEPVDFKTIGFTEYANCIIMAPLCVDLRTYQMQEAYRDDVKMSHDYIEFFRDKILNSDANKYEGITNPNTTKAKTAVVALPGDNKLKKFISVKKLRAIAKKHKDDFLLKPHPMTHFKTIGELMDMFGECNVALRGDDLYKLLKDSSVVYSSVHSESAMYAVALDKILEPIDSYDKQKRAGFYHINYPLFHEPNPQEWVNRTFNSHKSGVICPNLDKDWKAKLKAYLDYMAGIKRKFKELYA